MAHRTGILIVTAAFVLVGFSRRAAGQETLAPALTLRVYDYAGINSGMMRAAREKVARIYQEAGVLVEWIEPLANRHNGSTTVASSSLPTFTVRVLIRPKMVSKHGSATGTVMGVALEADESGGIVWLFYDRVLRVAQHHRQPIADLLAIALAHEVGHLLLPPPGHAPSGLMRAEWDGNDLRHAVVGELAFTATEASHIRARLAGCCRNQRLRGAK